ncbi:MAG: anthranilate phosphoribosyltransferase, partial [Sphingomonadales bacterium]|nr:anthranilate phosphoribosyltransferase [Sphingomonadales bacterium]
QARPASEPGPTIEEEAEEALLCLLEGVDLTRSQAKVLFGALVAGRLDDPTIATMLTALRLKGETTDELIGGAKALRAADADFPRPDYLFADSCGTGGDGSGSINVSTAAAFVAAGAGLPVAKHGNRSFTSRCGSADVLERLGAKLDLAPERSREILDETGFCFLFAPHYHPGLKHAGPARLALKVRTIMNLLGPCLNPAEPQVQLLGVADPERLEPIARTLQALGVEKALVVHGSGLDEVALHGATDAVRLEGGQTERLTMTPEEAGLDRAPLTAIRGGDPAENAEGLEALLRGEAPAAHADLIALNAGALLFTAGKAGDLAAGVAQAREAIRSGAARGVLAGYVEASHG